MRSSVHGASGVGSVIKGMAGLGGLSLGAHIAYEVRKHGLVESWHKSLKRKGTAFRLTEAGRWAGVRSGLLHFMYVWRQRRLRADPKVDAMAEAMAVGDMHASFYEHTGELNDPAQKEQKTASAYAEMMLATRNRKGAVLDIDSATDGLPRYTKQEVATHRSKSDCWLIIRNRVYDVTSWCEERPMVVPSCQGQDLINWLICAEGCLHIRVALEFFCSTLGRTRRPYFAKLSTRYVCERENALPVEQ
eukprot:SAG31_NODE_1758_length_7335_cov_18.704600_7_plen_247_part_00